MQQLNRELLILYQQYHQYSFLRLRNNSSSESGQQNAVSAHCFHVLLNRHFLLLLAEV
jgi:hypothetical protein